MKMVQDSFHKRWRKTAAAPPTRLPHANPRGTRAQVLRRLSRSAEARAAEAAYAAAQQREAADVLAAERAVALSGERGKKAEAARAAERARVISAHAAPLAAALAALEAARRRAELRLKRPDFARHLQVPSRTRPTPKSGGSAPGPRAANNPRGASAGRGGATARAARAHSA